MFAITQRSSPCVVKLQGGLIASLIVLCMCTSSLLVAWHFRPWGPGTFSENIPLLAFLGLLLLILALTLPFRTELEIVRYSSGLYIEGIEDGARASASIHQPLAAWYRRWIYTGLVLGFVPAALALMRLLPQHA